MARLNSGVMSKGRDWQAATPREEVLISYALGP